MRLNLQASSKEKDRRSAKADALVQTFQGMSPTEAAAWIDANVHNIATAKNVLKAFAKILVVLSQKL